MLVETRPTRRAPRDVGFTLIEVLVALAIATLVLSAAAAALITVQRSGTASEARDRASQIANDRIEQIRALPWEQVAHQAAIAASPGDPGFGETAVSSPDATGRAPMVPSETVTIGANTFTIATRVTWTPSATSLTTPNQPGLGVDNVNNNTAAAGADGVPDDAAKRISVRVTGTINGAAKTFIAQTVRYPTLDEVIPSVTKASGSVRTCALPTPSAFCNLSVTTGTVLTSPSAGLYQASVPVVLKATTKAATASVTLTVKGQNFALTNPSSDGVTWGATLPVGTTLPLGDSGMTFRNAAGATQVYAGGAWWAPNTSVPEIVPAAGSAWYGEPGSLRAKSGRTSTDATAPTGSENATDAICVNAATGEVWNYMVAFFDLRNFNDQDGAATAKPTVTITGTRDTYNTARTISRTIADNWIGKPSGNVTGALAANAAGTGYVGARASAQGAMNTTRWYAAIPPSFFFHPSATKTVMTISEQRPHDGYLAQNFVVIPIKKTASAAACDVDSPGQPTGVVATGTGTSTTVTWNAVPYAASYKVYRAVRVTEADTLSWSLVSTQSTTSYTYAPGAGREVSYKVIATNRYGDGPESAVAAAVTVPLAPSVPGNTEYGSFWGLYERTYVRNSPSWVTSANMYRSTDGATAVLQARGVAEGADWNFSGPQGGLAPLPDPGHNHVYSAEVCNAAGCSARVAGTAQRVPFWWGAFDDGAKLHLDLRNTAYGNAGLYTNANLYRDGTDLTFGQPSAWRTAPDYSILFQPRGHVQWAGAYSPMPAGNAPRSFEWSFKESGGFSAGWIFANIGATASPAAPAPGSGFSAYNRASGVVTMNWNFGANPAEWTGLKINDGAWHMYAITFDGTNVILYEDGVSKGSRTLTTVNTVSNRDHVWNQSSVSTSTPDGLSGWYDELIHYQRVLTPAEVADRWASRADS